MLSFLQSCPRTPADASESSEQSLPLAYEESHSRSSVIYVLCSSAILYYLRAPLIVIYHAESSLIAGHFSACAFFTLMRLFNTLSDFLG